MRSTDKRLAAVKQRSRELQKEQKLRSNRIISLSSIAASLVFIIGLGFAMPGIMAQMDTGEYLSLSGMASIFSADNGIGYVMIALIAFTLGVCVTILCVHWQRRTKEIACQDGKGDEPHD